MMKFFRKYNRQLIAVFMSLLMIVFVGGSALQGLLSRVPNDVIGESRLGPITYWDQQMVQQETSILNRLGLRWEYPFPGTPQKLTELDWILLTREAKKLGVERDSAALKNVLAEQFGPDALESYARQMRVKPDKILEAFGQMESVRNIVRTMAGASLPSEAEVRAAARNALEKVWITAVYLPASMFVDKDEVIPEAALLAHFEKYRDKVPGRGLSFGYFRDDAVDLEYIRIDRDVIASSRRVANLEDKAKTYFEKNRTTDPLFRKPDDTLDLSGDEGEPEEKSSFMAWEEAKGIALDAVREQEAEVAAGIIADWLVQHLQEPWFDMERSKDGYRSAPPAVEAPDYYQKVISRIPASIAFPEAVSIDRTGSFTQRGASEVKDIGRAGFRPERGAGAALSKLAFENQGIVPKVPSGSGVNRDEYLTLLQTCPYPLKDGDGNYFVFRVMNVREGHPAETLDEVRNKVAIDLRLLRAFERAREHADGLVGCYPEETLEEAYGLDEELVALKNTPEGSGSGFFKPPPFPRMSRYVAATGRTRPTTYIPGGIGSVPNEVIDLCFELGGKGGTVAVSELRDRAAVLAIQWIKTDPPTQEEFDEIREQLTSDLTRQRAKIAVSDWLEPEKIRARNGFAFARDTGLQ